MVICQLHIPGIPASRIIAASIKRPISSVPFHQFPAASGAFLLHFRIISGRAHTPAHLLIAFLIHHTVIEGPMSALRADMKIGGQIYQTVMGQLLHPVYIIPPWHDLKTSCQSCEYYDPPEYPSQ